jgi:hypothetical protein
MLLLSSCGLIRDQAGCNRSQLHLRLGELTESLRPTWEGHEAESDDQQRDREARQMKPGREGAKESRLLICDRMVRTTGGEYLESGGVLGFRAAAQ